MFDLRRIHVAFMAQVCMKFAAAVLLFAATFTQADVVEHHDRRRQIVDYSVTGTTAEPQGTVHDITFETNVLYTGPDFKNIQHYLGVMYA